MWKDMVQPDRPQMTVWCMRIACWVTKAQAHTHTHIHREYVIIITFHLQQMLPCYIMRTLPLLVSIAKSIMALRLIQTLE
jgi:hypothetical protein